MSSLVTSSTVPTSSAADAANAAKDAAQAQATAMPLQYRMVLAACSGMVAATVCHPLDVIRVQMQTEGTQFKSTVDAGLSIYRNGGLYAGISAAYLRQWLYGSFRIGVYSYQFEHAQLENQKAGRSKNDISFANKLRFGCVSGAIGSFVGTPSELSLVRMSADSKLPVESRRGYTNVVDCIVRIAKEEGFTKLWRGATPTVARATLLSACQLGVTSEVKGKLARSGFFGEGGQLYGGIPMLFCATLCSSFCANIVANPFDVVKSRMQNMPIRADGTAAYSSMADCFVKSVRSEGPAVLYSGFVPAFVKLAPYTVISLTIADKLTQALTGKSAL